MGGLRFVKNQCKMGVGEHRKTTIKRICVGYCPVFVGVDNFISQHWGRFKSLGAVVMPIDIILYVAVMFV